MTYRSFRPDVDIPATPLVDFVLAGAGGRSSRAALVDGISGRTITYGELPDTVERAAAGLARLGVAKGDVCAIFSPNTPDYIVALLAIARLGAVVTTASPLNTAADVAKQLVDSRARVLITSSTLAPTWTDAITGTSVDHVITFDDGNGTRSFASVLATPGPAPHVAIDPDDLVALPYSSGTTGLPKGVMLTHRNLVANILQTDSARHYVHDGDTTVAFLPFFHIYGMALIALQGLWAGVTIVVMPRFELEAYLGLVERHRATMLHVVPPVVVALAKHPSVDRFDFSAVRKLFSGAAPLGADLIEQCTRRLGCILQQGYGLTETSPATHVTSDEPSSVVNGSVGGTVANTECRIVDPGTLRDVTSGADGEVWIRGPQVMRGYFNRPEDTRASLDADGWFHTGDIGRVDSGENLFIVDRLKELIKYKGMQVPPAELEAVLLSHPAVGDAAVVPLPDEEAGEIPRAFVVLKTPVTPEELMAYVAARVAAYKKVRRVEFIDAIPKSPSGKILRRLLREAPTSARGG